LKEKIRIKKPRYLRIISKEEINLQKLKALLKNFYDIDYIVYKSISGIGTVYYKLNINKKEQVKKLIRLDFIPNILNIL
jgi:D-hexose-6-phosphate mutarotase